MTSKLLFQILITLLSVLLVYQLSTLWLSTQNTSERQSMYQFQSAMSEIETQQFNQQGQKTDNLIALHQIRQQQYDSLQQVRFKQTSSPTPSTDTAVADISNTTLSGAVFTVAAQQARYRESDNIYELFGDVQVESTDQNSTQLNTEYLQYKADSGDFYTESAVIMKYLNTRIDAIGMSGNIKSEVLKLHDKVRSVIQQ